MKGQEILTNPISARILNDKKSYQPYVDYLYSFVQEFVIG